MSCCSTGGYTWTITFRDFDDPIEPLVPIPDGLTGTDVEATLTILNNPPRKARGLVRVFTYTGQDQWVEQAYLYPMLKQKQVRRQTSTLKIPPSSADPETYSVVIFAGSFRA